jgi:hypothetical protein
VLLDGMGAGEETIVASCVKGWFVTSCNGNRVVVNQW